MRKVFLDELPKWDKNGRYKGKINWKQSIGHKINFIYDDIHGEFEIVDYKIPYLSLRYENNLHNIATSSLIGSRLGLIIGTVCTDYYYDVGDQVKTNKGTIEILEQIRIRDRRGYRYRCLKDNNIDKISEYDLKNGQGCNVCSNTKVMQGINDISTTHPHLMDFFVNIEHSYTVSHGSAKEVTLKCVECGFLKERRVVDLVNNGFACPICSDSISYPEKFLGSLLSQLNIEYKQQFSSEWSKGKKYDFYIEPDIIIETHGEQHYFNSFKHIGGKSLNDERENDKLKEKLAKMNGIDNYIVIDCRKSELEWIKKNVLNSDLNSIYELSNVNWLECHETACKSLVKEVSDLWNKGYDSPNKIAFEINLHDSTVRKYLKRGRELGWNNYDETKTLEPVYKSRRKKIICLNTLEIFDYSKEIEEKYGVKNSFVNAVCNGKNKYIKINNEPFVFMFYDEYINNEVCVENILKDVHTVFEEKRQKQPVCLNTNEIFSTLKEASDKYNIAYPSIIKCCNGLSSYAGKLPTTKEKLIWMYLKDYELLTNDELMKIKSKFNDRSVVQLTKNMEYIKEFQSLDEASDILNIEKVYISEVLKNKRKSSNGYVFMYCEDYEQNKDNLTKIKYKSRSKEVLQLDVELNILKQFKSVTEAHETTKISHISTVCRGERQKAGGYKWMYKEDYEKYIEENK